MSLFSDWPGNWFGDWKWSASDDLQSPLFDELVDVTWCPPDLSKIVGYLQSCPAVLTCSTIPEPCSLCGEVLMGIGSQRADGVWAWSGTLSHFVSRHHVRLPDRMIEHIRSREYLPPEKGGSRITS